MSTIARIDVAHGRGQPPAAVGRRIGPQQAAVAVDHDGGEFDGFAERGRAEGVEPEGERLPPTTHALSRCARGDAKLSPRGRCVPSPLVGEG